MAKICRIATAQLDYHPAFEGDGLQCLCEPKGEWEPGVGLSGLKLRDREWKQRLKRLREKIQQVYLEAYRPRVEAIIKFCRHLDVDLLVLPEYSIPGWMLPYLSELIGERMMLVAGSHTVTYELLESMTYRR